jgi:ATP-dependent RNA helicase DeaD
VAYGIAIAETLLEGADTLRHPREPLALIIAPTRELALQVQRELNWLYQYAGARVVSCVGGMDIVRERHQLQDGAHIVVGTPGRLRDHLERGALRMGSLKAVVLDEADEMLDMGFREDLEFILETTPPERRTLLFSATLPKAIVAMATNYQRDALRIQTAGETRGHADIEYRAVRVAHNRAEATIVNLLRALDPPGALVFCATRNAVRHLEAFLLERGFAAVALSGELSQHERNHALQALRDGRAKVCVATDVAARGIDLPNLALVIQAELPHDAEVMQHRSGRTGRAGRKGVSILLVSNSRRRRAEEMFRRAGVEVRWTDAPSADEIRKLDDERLLQSPLLAEAASEDDLAMADAMIAAHGPRAAAAAFVKMARAQMPAPEDVGEPERRPDQHQQQRQPRPRREDRPPNRAERRAAKFGPAPDESAPSQQDYRPREPRRERAPQASTGKMQNGVWFKASVGRERNADPKWLLPEICRQGEIEKSDIGAIRIYERETRFEVSPDVAERFAALVADRKKGGIRLFPAPAELPIDAQDDAPRDAKPYKSGGKKPFKKKPFDKKPFNKDKRDGGGGYPKRQKPRD